MSDKDVPPTPPKVLLQYELDEKRFSEEIAINPNDITGAMMTNSAMYAYYAHQWAKSEYQYDRLKTRLTKLEAILDTQYRKAFSDEGVKATEKAVDASIRQDNRWDALADLVLKAKLIMNMHRANKEAFEQRGEHLRSIGASDRVQMQGEIRTNFNPGGSSVKDRAREIAAGEH